jgi:hypothetical protein
MKTGVILVVTSWLNDALVTELEKHGCDIRIVCFGVGKSVVSRIRLRHGTCPVSCYSAGAFHTRKYCAVLLRELKVLRASGAEYLLCLHGDAALLVSLDELFVAIRENPVCSIIENRSRPTGTEEKLLTSYHIGHPVADVLVTYIAKGLDNMRYKTVGIHCGHDAWGLSAAATDYLLASAMTPYMYRLCRFSWKPRHYFFHTLVYHSSTEALHGSPERYCANTGYDGYRSAYRDHAAALLAEGSGLFYPASPTVPVFAPAAEQEDQSAGTAHSPYREYLSSRHPLLYQYDNIFGPLPHVPKPFFTVYFFEDAAVRPLVSALNNAPGVACCAAVDDSEAMRRLQCPVLRPVADSASGYAAFATDLLNFFPDVSCGFLLKIGQNADWETVWQLPNCQSVFILPDALSPLFAWSVTSKNRKQLSFAASLSSAQNQKSHCAPDVNSSTLASLLAILQQQKSDVNLPLFFTESFVRDDKGINACINEVTGRMHAIQKNINAVSEMRGAKCDAMTLSVVKQAATPVRGAAS